MGQVWRAVDEVLGRDVAVKVLKDEFVDDPTFLARFRAEARAAAPLTHPGIAQVFDYGEGEGSDGHTAYLVMELVPGEPLSALLAREGRLGTARTLDLVAQAAEALHVAHTAGVVHRDVKPGNLLVTPEGAVRVTDFGIARAADAVPLTQTGTVLGTAHYLSPEQASGRPVTPASDVYALGVVAYECLTGRRLFEHSSAVAVALAHAREEAPALPDEVPVRVRELVASCLAKDPAARPASAAALAAAATRLRADVGPEAGLGALGVALPPAVADAAPDRAVLDLPTTAYAQPSGIGSAAVGSAAGSSTATRALSLPHADPPTPPAPPPPGPPAMSPRGAVRAAAGSSAAPRPRRGSRAAHARRRGRRSSAGVVAVERGGQGPSCGRGSAALDHADRLRDRSRGRASPPGEASAGGPRRARGTRAARQRARGHLRRQGRYGG
jgi:serine/threonine-protein kinase